MVMDPKRIIAFGCSNTYGHGLSDCFEPNSREAGPVPSRLAWPQLVANRMGYECVNLGICGASNKLITCIAQDYQFGSRDVAVFLWSYLHRHCILGPGTGDSVSGVEYTQLGSLHPSFHTKLDRMWLKHFYYEEDAVWDYNLRQDWTWRFLRDKGIQSYHMSVEPHFAKQLDFNQAAQLDVNYHAIINKHGKALDKVHPDHLAQQELADLIVKQLRVKLS